MRVEIRTQKDVLVPEAPAGRQVQTRYNVVLMSKGLEIDLVGFLTPGTFLDGFLSDTQAKTRARDVADRMKKFLASQGELDDEQPAGRTGSRRASESAYAEPKTFAARA